MEKQLGESLLGLLREEIAATDQASSFQQACVDFWTGILDCIAELQSGRLNETDQALSEIVLPGLVKLVAVAHGSEASVDNSQTLGNAAQAADLKTEEMTAQQNTSSLLQGLLAASHFASALCEQTAKANMAAWPEAAARQIIDSLSSMQAHERDKRAVILYPIGTVENDVEELLPPNEIKAHLSRIIIDPALSRGLDGLTENQRLLVVFQFHRLQGYELYQHPKNNPRLPKTGVFALHSPRRPNPIGVTEVILLERRENVLLVRGLDAVNGTPVLDLKLNR